MRIEQLVQNNKLIGTKKIVTRKQRKVGALFNTLCFCFKAVPNKAQTLRCFARTVYFVPSNNCIGKVVQTQNSTMAHKNSMAHNGT